MPAQVIVWDGMTSVQGPRVSFSARFVSGEGKVVRFLSKKPETAIVCLPTISLLSLGSTMYSGFHRYVTND